MSAKMSPREQNLLGLLAIVVVAASAIALEPPRKGELSQPTTSQGDREDGGAVSCDISKHHPQ